MTQPVKIVYNAFRGLFTDSPRAIFEALQARGHQAESVWFSSPRTTADFPSDVTLVPYGGPECIAALEAADLVVSNDGIGLAWEKRRGATYLQTWHGTPLKRLHHDMLAAPASMLAAIERDMPRWDMLLSPNPPSTERLRRAFGYRGPIHETGLPRNDLLSSPLRKQLRAAVRAELGIADHQTVVLYTPTWRDDLVFENSGSGDFGFPIDVEDFTGRLGPDHVLLVRLHHMVTGRLGKVTGPAVRDVSDHLDNRELYLAADLMVTDYSSTMFDFAITGKPMLFYTYDLEDYRDRVRGFYFDLEEVAPGPLVRTSEDLVSAIADLDAVRVRYADRYASFRETFCCLDDGHATERVLDLLFPSGITAGPAPLAINGRS